MLAIALLIVLVIAIIWCYCNVNTDEPLVSHWGKSNTFGISYGPIAVMDGAIMSKEETKFMPQVSLNGLDKGFYTVIMYHEDYIQWLITNIPHNKPISHGYLVVPYMAPVDSSTDKESPENNNSPAGEELPADGSAHKKYCFEVFKQKGKMDVGEVNRSGFDLDKFKKEYKLKSLGETSFLSDSD